MSATDTQRASSYWSCYQGQGWWNRSIDTPGCNLDEFCFIVIIPAYDENDEKWWKIAFLKENAPVIKIALIVY